MRDWEGSHDGARRVRSVFAVFVRLSSHHINPLTLALSASSSLPIDFLLSLSFFLFPGPSGHPAFSPLSPLSPPVVPFPRNSTKNFSAPSLDPPFRF